MNAKDSVKKTRLPVEVKKQRKSEICYQVLRNLPNATNMQSLKEFVSKFTIDTSIVKCKYLWKFNLLNSSCQPVPGSDTRALAGVEFDEDIDAKKFFTEVKCGHHRFQGHPVWITTLRDYELSLKLKVPEMWRLVFQYFTLTEKAILIKVCSEWKNVINSVWSIQRRLTSWDVQGMDKKIITSVFKNCHTFTDISINFTHDCAEMMLNAVKDSYTNLEKLHIDFGGLDDSRRYKVFSDMHDTLQLNKKLIVLDLINVPPVLQLRASVLPSNLRKMSYKRNIGGSEMVKKIQGLLPPPADSVYWTKLKDILVQCPKLEILKVTGHFLMNERREIQSFKHLSELELSFCYCIYLDCIPELRFLTELTLRGTNLNDGTLFHIIKRVIHLEALDVSGSKNLNLEKATIFACAPKLQMFLCLNCPKVSTFVIRSLLNSWLHLRFLAFNTELIDLRIAGIINNIWVRSNRKQILRVVMSDKYRKPSDCCDAVTSLLKFTMLPSKLADTEQYPLLYDYVDRLKATYKATFFNSQTSKSLKAKH